MPACGTMSLLTVALVMALLWSTSAAKVVKRDLGDENTRRVAVTTPHIDLLVSLNDGETQTVKDGSFAKYRLGDRVTIICICEGYPHQLARLSWWEGKQKLPSLTQYAQFSRSSSTTLTDLTLDHSGRTFTCRANGSTSKKTLTLQVDFSSPDEPEEAPVSKLHVVVNHQAAMGGNGLVLYGAGDQLSLVCLMQGMDVSRVSWWEGETQLMTDSPSVRREHASSSTLVLRHLATGDTGRRLSCRVDDSTLHQTVELMLNNPGPDMSSPENQKQTWTTHFFGGITLSSKEINTQTIIGIWLVIILFILVAFVIAMFCRTRSPASSSSTSSPRSSPSKKSSEKGYDYSQIGVTVASQGMKNRTLVFGRRNSASTVPTACTGYGGKTHDEEMASVHGHTNPGFVPLVSDV